ncbi:sensor histidine kinase [Loktanella sp. Alg231-35]|uniref:sensor histidine kinase n=1 Tax=Loktanella sp. Alg231-35 TaxID=1922220 RepID=UPI000D561307|nr:ATP-binding protein [Loktanella sp. Alg231-35]
MIAENIVLLVDAIPIPIIVIGQNDRIKAINGPGESIFGPHLTGRPHVSVVRQPALVSAIAKVRAQGDRQVTRYVNRDGATDIRYRVAVAAAGQDIVVTFEDQTASEEAGQMRRDFVANVSHELRTPLTALLGFIETLGGAARDDPAARDRFLEIMAHEANRMTRLVDDLLSLSRVEEDERVRPKEDVDLRALLPSVIKGLEPQAKAAEVTVALDIQVPDAMVAGDAGQLVQVFANIVENAIKYGASGKQVKVTLVGRTVDARLRAEVVEISVADQGEGIASHHIARLTERFYRVDSHRSRQVGGTGLGLAIVKHIINRHRGRMQIESEEGQGTKISVFLPTSQLS